jgi:hypothetical protein
MFETLTVHICSHATPAAVEQIFCVFKIQLQVHAMLQLQLGHLTASRANSKVLQLLYSGDLDGEATLALTAVLVAADGGTAAAPTGAGAFEVAGFVRAICFLSCDLLRDGTIPGRSTVQNCSLITSSCTTTTCLRSQQHETI